MIADSWASAFGESGALFTRAGTCRTLLWRVFDRTGDRSLLGVVMKNPSVAGVYDDDQTIRVLRRVAKDAGAGGFLVGNLVPLVATDPKAMVMRMDARRASIAALGEWEGLMSENYTQLQRIRMHCPRVLFAWGRLDTEALASIASTVRLYFSRPNYGGNVYVLGRTKTGQPRHPLRTKMDGLHSLSQTSPASALPLEAVGREAGKP